MTNEEIGAAITDLKISLGAYRAEVTAQNTVTNAKLISIEEKLCKQNGRVGKLEDRVVPLENHLVNTAELPEKIRRLEDEALSNRSVKKFMLLMFTSGCALGGLVVAVIKLAIG
mgnify:FL=1